MKKYRCVSLVLAFMLVFGVGVFANCDSVYASTVNSYPSLSEGQIFHFVGNGHYIDISLVSFSCDSPVYAFSFVNDSDEVANAIFFFSNSPFDLTLQFESDFLSCRQNKYSSYFENGFNKYILPTDVGLADDYDYFSPSHFFCSFPFIHNDSNYSGSLSYSDYCALKILSGEFESLSITYDRLIRNSYDSDSAQYSSDLGHLENVTVKQLDTDNDNQIDCFRFAWNRRSSTGVDLDERGYDVEYWYEMKYSYTDIFGKQHDYSGQTEKLYVSDKSDRRSAVYEYSSSGSKFWDLYMEVFTNTFSSPMKTLEKKIAFYARPIYFDGENSCYGDLTTVNIDPKFDSLDYDVTTDNGDGTTSSSSGSTSTGRGDSLEEALDNSVVHDPALNIGDTDIPGVLSNFVEGVKSFQVLFSAFLSFMPQWVLAFLIACIVIWCIMIVKKAILG